MAMISIYLLLGFIVNVFMYESERASEYSRKVFWYPYDVIVEIFDLLCLINVSSNDLAHSCQSATFTNCIYVKPFVIGNTLVSCWQVASLWKKIKISVKSKIFKNIKNLGMVWIYLKITAGSCWYLNSCWIYVNIQIMHFNLFLSGIGNSFCLL